MKLISPTKAAHVKNCSRQTIHTAINDGRLRTLVVVDGGDRSIVIDKDFESFKPRYGPGSE